jgi:carbon-monoxide dehydrogenase medium subunit
MKASAFAYARATSVANALELLAVHRDKARVLAGGQSLIPAMNLRLVAPEVTVDTGELAELRGIAVKGETLLIGARTRHADPLKSSDIVKCAPPLGPAVAHMAPRDSADTAGYPDGLGAEPDEGRRRQDQIRSRQTTMT